MSGKTKLEVEVANPTIAKEGHVVYEVVWDVTEPAAGDSGLYRTRRLRWKTLKRYNDFYALDKEVRSQYGAAAALIKLPPGKIFGSKDPTFIRERQVALQDYLFSLLEDVHGLLDFEGHLGSKAFRDFCQWDARETLNSLPVPTGAGPAAGGAGAMPGSSTSPPASGAGAASAATVRVSTGMAARRIASRSAAVSGNYSAAAAQEAAPVTFALVTPTGLVPARPSANMSALSTGPLAPAAASRPPVSSSASYQPRPGPSAASPMPQTAAPAATAKPPAAAAPAPAAAVSAPAASARPPRPAGGPAPAPGPAPPAPPPAAAAAVPPADPSRNALLGDIRGGLKLKKAKTNDRSAPKV